MFCKEKIQLNETYCDYNADPGVIDFIRNFLCKDNNEDTVRALQTIFSGGYCYYFAHMLKLAFQRGEVCWCAPYGHFCWVDEDEIPYDIFGICVTEAEHFIPEHYLGNAITDFLHNGVFYGATEQEIKNIITRYKNENWNMLKAVYGKRLCAKAYSLFYCLRNYTIEH